MKCYYGEDFCNDDLWQCETCDEWYCTEHFHSTDLGENTECVACEYTRKYLEEQE